jgi:hypothetical protein
MAPDDPREPRFRYPEELQIEPQVLPLPAGRRFSRRWFALGFLGVLL